MVKCKCGKNLNEKNIVSTQKLFDMILKEYVCDDCSNTFVTRNGKFLKEGRIIPLSKMR